MLVGKITVLFHEDVDEIHPFIVPLGSNQNWVQNELGDKPSSCLIMIDGLVFNSICHNGGIWGQKVTNQ